MNYQVAFNPTTLFTLSYTLESGVELKGDKQSLHDVVLKSSKLIAASDSFYRRFEYLNPALMMGSSYQALLDYLSDFIDHADGKLFESILTSAISNGFLEAHSQPVFFTLRSCHCAINLQGTVQEGSLKGFDVMISLADSKRELPLEISQLTKAVLAQSGEHFFDNMVLTLNRVLSVDTVAVVSIDNQDFKVLAGCYSGQLQQGFQASIEFSPFADLSHSYHYLSSKVAESYPHCEWLLDQKVSSMLNIPLRNSDGLCMAVISLMHSEPIHDIEFVRALLSVFSARVCSEVEHRQLALANDLKQRRYQDLIEKSQSGMFVLELSPAMPLKLSLSEQIDYLKSNASFKECNLAYLKLHGLINEHELINRPLSAVLGDEVSDQLITQFVEQTYSINNAVSQFLLANTSVWISSSYRSQINNQTLTHIYGISDDITERIQQTERLAFLANHDELTQLPNRRFFKEEFEAEIIRCQKQHHLALFILDLDGFKEVNDTLGHVTGDELLKLVGPRVQQCLIDYKVKIARLGGDEFGLLIKDVAKESALLDVGILIMQAIKTPFRVNGLDLRIAGSIGISLYPKHGEDYSSLMRCADIAMYRAKELSKDFEIYQAEDDYYSVRRLSLMMEMRDAVDDGQLVLYYQPITRIDDKTIKGFEALIRWNHPVHGLIPPGEFIPLIELTDVVEPMTWWVIETAIKQLQIWQSQGRGYSVSVNVSTRNISEDSFVYRLSRLLRQYDVDGRFLEIEITESTLMADPVKGRSVLKAMSAMGVHFAIDDFGTGYSSLAYLKSLPINTLKIDRTFIDQMLENEQDQIIVKSTIQLAHNLGMKVTAEGIEDGRLIQELATLGCDFGQGYFICRPIPIDALEEWLYQYDMGQHPISNLSLI